MADQIQNIPLGLLAAAANPAMLPLAGLLPSVPAGRMPAAAAPPSGSQRPFAGLFNTGDKPSGYTPQDVQSILGNQADYWQRFPITPQWNGGKGLGGIGPGIANFGSGYMATAIPAQQQARAQENERIRREAATGASQATTLEEAVRALSGGSPEQQQAGLNARLPMLAEDARIQRAMERERMLEEEERRGAGAPPAAAQPQQGPPVTGTAPSPVAPPTAALPPPTAAPAQLPRAENLASNLSNFSPLPPSAPAGGPPAAGPAPPPAAPAAAAPAAGGPAAPAPDQAATADRNAWFRPRQSPSDNASPERLRIMRRLRAGVYSPEQAKMALEAVAQRPYENAYDTASAGHYAERYRDLIRDRGAADRRLSDWRIFEQVASNPATLQGPGAQSISLPLRRLGATLGIQSEGLDATQLFQAIAGRMALEARNPSSGAGMPGAMSDQDREFLQAITGGVGNTREANLALARIHQRLAQRQVETADNAIIYAQNNRGRLDGGFDPLQIAWSQANPLFTQADFAALRGGSPGGQANQAAAGPYTEFRRNPDSGEVQAYNSVTGQTEIVTQDGPGGAWRPRSALENAYPGSYGRRPAPAPAPMPEMQPMRPSQRPPWYSPPSSLTGR